MENQYKIQAEILQQRVDTLECEKNHWLIERERLQEENERIEAIEEGRQKGQQAKIGDDVFDDSLNLDDELVIDKNTDPTDTFEISVLSSVFDELFDFR